MKVLFDTNIILDVLLARQPFAELSATLVSQVEQRQIEGYLCATTLTTIDYLLNKSLPAAQAKVALKTLLTLFQVAEVNKTVLQLAVDSGFRDFEDAVQHFAGKMAGIDALVSRNQQDFKQAEYPVYSPQELWAVLNSQS